ncbi:MAG: hypothetical protein U1E97_02470 [Alphaproteobacteria bacterium]
MSMASRWNQKWVWPGEPEAKNGLGLGHPGGLQGRSGDSDAQVPRTVRPARPCALPTAGKRIGGLCLASASFRFARKRAIKTRVFRFEARCTVRAIICARSTWKCLGIARHFGKRPIGAMARYQFGTHMADALRVGDGTFGFGKRPGKVVGENQGDGQHGLIGYGDAGRSGGLGLFDAAGKILAGGHHSSARIFGIAQPAQGLGLHIRGQARSAAAGRIGGPPSIARYDPTGNEDCRARTLDAGQHGVIPGSRRQGLGFIDGRKRPGDP